MSQETTPTEVAENFVPLIGIEKTEIAPDVKTGGPFVTRWMLVVSPASIAAVESLVLKAAAEGAAAFAKELRQRTGAA